MLLPGLDANSALSTLLESVPCGVLAFDIHGELSLANGPLANLLGLGSERLHELRTFESVVACLAPRFSNPESVAARWRQHFAGDESSWDELDLISPARKILERFGRPIVDSSPDSNGVRAGWIEIYRDVTGQRL